MLLRCLARRTLSTTRVALTGGPAPFNALPGSFLNGEDGREMLKKPEIGPVGKEEVRLSLIFRTYSIFRKKAYQSHEYYNHDKVSFYDALADCNHMRVEPVDAGFVDVKHRK